MKEKELILPDDWEVKEVVGNRIILREKETELPKTWEECHSSLECLPLCDEHEKNDIPVELTESMQTLCQLLVCRNVWWKQLGWKPDLNDKNIKYCIANVSSHVVKMGCYENNRILAFPTEEIRDQFLESFRDLIEEAKELL